MKVRYNILGTGVIEAKIFCLRVKYMNKVKMLSDFIMKNEINQNVEEILWDNDIIINEGFYVEVYLSDNADSKSIFRYINKDIRYDEFIMLDIFNGNTPKNNTMSINIIPNEDINYKTDRDRCTNLL